MCFSFTVVGIRLGLTFELKQRVYAVSELTVDERDYRSLVTEENLIDSGLVQASLSQYSPFAN